MRLFKSRKNDSLVDQEVFEQRQQQEDEEDDDINDVRELEGKGSELAEQDQFEIFVLKKDHRIRTNQQKKKYMFFLSDHFGHKGHIEEDDSTISSITTEGKRRMRLLQAGLYQVAASTGGSWFFNCCNDSTTTAPPTAVPVQPSQRMPVVQLPKVDYAQSYTSLARSTAANAASNVNKSTVMTPTRTSATNDNTMLTQTSFRFNSKMQERYINSMLQRKKQEKIKQQNKNNNSLVQFLLCGAAGVYKNDNNDLSLSSPADRTRSSNISSTHNTATTNPTALFDTLSEDDGDGENAQQQPREQPIVNASGKGVSEARRERRIKVFRRLSSVSLSKSGKKILKGSLFRKNYKKTNGGKEGTLSQQNHIISYLENDDMLPTVGTQPSLLDESIIIKFNSSYVDALQLPPPAIPLKRANEIKL